MCPRRRVEIGQEYLKAQRKGQQLLFLTFQRMVSPSAILNKTGGKRIRHRFQSINAHVERRICKYTQFQQLTDVHYVDNDLCTLTSFLTFFLLSACPQTDTAQLYNTQPDFRARTSGSKQALIESGHFNIKFGRNKCSYTVIL